MMAAAELQQYLAQTDLDHNFGLTEGDVDTADGKMFGVLVVKNKQGRIGYLSAFSGKLAGRNHHARFVPPVFDMLDENGFFIKGMVAIDAVNAQIEEISLDEHYDGARREFEELLASAAAEISTLKEELKNNKSIRRGQRDEQRGRMDTDAYAKLEAELIEQSRYDKRRSKALEKAWEERLDKMRTLLAPTNDRLEGLRNERKEMSAALQERLFEQYSFLNRAGKSRSLHDIFSQTVFGKPPSAAGECATPKLLQFAFKNGYEPLSMAEFWWGASSGSEIRKHKQFYPACAGKCKPILAHMLEGMAIEEEPLQVMPEENKLEVVYEDDHFLVVNKPAGLLSVPGVNIPDSVYSRLKVMLSIEPYLVHRLDMDTSGLLVAAKDQGTYKHIQKQFLDRVVNKRYTALLSKIIDQAEGEICLPLRADIYDRPRQLVCLEQGKKSVTRWRLIGVEARMSRIHFWPLTGRTHQLRVHAAHELGLNAPIVGDELYGAPAERLYLHAAYLSFVHPYSGERMSFEVAEEF